LKRLRDGLVDKFETIVKQEIISHNQAVLASNLAVNKLNDGLAETKQLLESRIVKLENALQAMTQKLLDKDAEIKQCKKSVADIMTESKTIHERNSRRIDEIESDCIRSFSDIREKLKRIDHIYSELDSISKEIESLRPTITSDQLKLSLTLMGAITKVKKEILETPNGVKELREDILKTLDMLRVEYEGIRKELTICKKSDFIYEKMFEDVYTQIKKNDLSRSGALN
jgi:uncharacterized coiled-coil DUF342 family protein